MTFPDKALSQYIGEVIASQGEKGWEILWGEQKTPWNAGQSAPSLVEAMKQGKIPEGRVLVPGCGMGFDLKIMASPRRFVLGIDISMTAVELARKYLQSESVQNAAVELLDFFEAPLEPFDAIYDYTFLCALSPNKRCQWARRVSSLIKPGGILFTLIFPTTKPLESGGPPFRLTAEDVSTLLSDDFICLELRAATESFEKRAGMEWVGIWKRKK